MKTNEIDCFDINDGKLIYAKSKVKKPIVVRMMGTNEEEGVRLLKEVGINSYPSMEKAIEEIVKL